MPMPSNKKAPAKAKVQPKSGGDQPESALLEGKKAPPFELESGDGKTLKLGDFAGRNLVLYFYPKDLTPGCTTEACSFRDNIGALKKLGAEVIGVSGDSTATHGKFTDKYGLNFPLLADVGNAVGKRYGVYKMKSLYGRKFMGIERTTFVIDKSGVVRRVFPKVKVNGHTDEVLEALRELQ